MRNQIIVYPKIQAIFGLPVLRPTADIPNTVGFKLVLVKRSQHGDSHIPVTVQKDLNGLHVCKDQRGTYRSCAAFDGWLPDKP